MARSPLVVGVVAGFLAALAVPASAQQTPPPRVVVEPVECIPGSAHGTAAIQVFPDAVDGGEVRLYFRREGYGDFYYVVAAQEAQGSYWAVLPIPEPDNHAAEVYAAVFDANGMLRGQSRVQVVPVTSSCEVLLDDEQTAASRDLVVGETALGQKFRKVAWWRCDGIHERIDVNGEFRDDQACVPIPFLERQAMMLPLLALPPGVVLLMPPPDASPSSP